MGQPRRARYTLRVRTGDVRGAGTDAAVSVNLVGAEGNETGWVALAARADQLERGQVRHRAGRRAVCSNAVLPRSHYVLS